MFTEATSMDKYMAISYFQKGVAHFWMQQFDEALIDFNDALLVRIFSIS